jgi:hypothetical protein
MTFFISDLPAFTYSHINYARLVIFSLAFQKTFKRGSQAGDEELFTRVRALLDRVLLA